MVLDFKVNRRLVVVMTINFFYTFSVSRFQRSALILLVAPMLNTQYFILLYFSSAFSKTISAFPSSSRLRT